MIEKRAVVAFAFGAPSNLVSNKRIAEIAVKKAIELASPAYIRQALIYTQRDVHFSYSLRRVMAPNVSAFVDVQYTAERAEGRSPPTLRIARGAVAWAKRLGIGELWIVAAKPHLWRCKRDLEYVIREAKAQIRIYVCEEIASSRDDEWYCPESTQPRACSKEAWRKRERILELTPMFIYKLIAS